MRILVFTALFALLAQAAAADMPLAIQRCDGAYNCITINTGPCGSFMMNDQNGITPGVAALADTNSPRIEGVCGFYRPPFYTPETPPPRPPAYNLRIPTDLNSP